jgi:hypothetical protein
MTKHEAARIVGILSAAHPAWRANEATVALWVEMLADLPNDAAMAAVRRLIATSGEWPSIAALRTEVARAAGMLPPPVDEACRQFLAAAKGREFEAHPAVTATAAALGGWYSVRASTNLSVMVGQFRSLYADFRAREVADIVVEGGGVAALEGKQQPRLRS